MNIATTIARHARHWRDGGVTDGRTSGVFPVNQPMRAWAQVDEVGTNMRTKRVYLPGTVGMSMEPYPQATKRPSQSVAYTCDSGVRGGHMGGCN